MQGNLIIDLQYGSTGKGLIAGFLAERDNPDTLCTAWAANAGHTYIDRAGRKFVHTMLANGIVSNALKRILIGPGSLIDPVALLREVEESSDLLKGVDIIIHPHAAVITQEHRDLEAGPMTKIGSTKKGVGEAAIQRIRRDPDNMNIAANHPELKRLCIDGWVVSTETYQQAMDCARVLQVEGAQGYSLSLYHGQYPYVTSRDVSTHQVLADCAIPPHIRARLTVVGTARAFPIRVANRYDESGAQVGYSGPCYADQYELDWQKDMGREPELTTVTKLPRRIFSFSANQMREAVRMCGVQELFLNFLNYCKDQQAARRFYGAVQMICDPYLCNVAYVGLGPTHYDVLDLPAHDLNLPSMHFLKRYWS